MIPKPKRMAFPYINDPKTETTVFSVAKSSQNRDEAINVVTIISTNGQKTR